MTLYLAPHSITTSLTAECAEHLLRRPEPAWQLSWHPDRLLTYEQASAAMELTELICALPCVSEAAWQRAHALADELRIDLEQACETLRGRRAERGEL
ncbi:hypothetical protein VMT65_25035 [Nocardia sp. CDC153]|uniref:hypothetical protein n=1 Tax=Nocardia sp. CDC153 TaxID=3112167 RepID=UPI002DBC1F85|nr:hypothetical protein [Nocardia sp. CDC153]MEC3956327.1 hypothetical protein [Nocardia sp. CDC153]